MQKIKLSHHQDPKKRILSYQRGWEKAQAAFQDFLKEYSNQN